MSEPQFGRSPPPGTFWMLGKTFDEIQAIQKESQESGKAPSEVIKTDDWKKHLIVRK
jgi:hypothetical protein